MTTDKNPLIDDSIEAAVRDKMRWAVWSMEDFHEHLASLRRDGLKPVDEHGRWDMRLLFRISMWYAMTWVAIEAWKKAKEGNYRTTASDDEIDRVIAEGEPLHGLLQNFRSGMFHLQPVSRFNEKFEDLMLHDDVDAWGLRLMQAFQVHLDRHPPPQPPASA